MLLAACAEPVARVALSPRRATRVKLVEIAAVLGATACLFYALREDMASFGRCVALGLVYVIRTASSPRRSLCTGLVAGVVGAATEQWGCAQGLWNWVDPAFHAGDRPTRSLWMVGGAPHGFPVEVVLAYAGAGWWMSSISCVVLAEEHTDYADAVGRGGGDRGGGELGGGSLRTWLWICTALPLLVLIVCEPAYLQSATLLCIGITLLLLFLRTRGARAATFGWGLLVGCAGFFFEVFATGGVLPEFAVWRYDPEIQRAVVARGAWQVPVPYIRTAPLSAFPAYVGTGLIIFSLSFIVAAEGAEMKKTI